MDYIIVGGGIYGCYTAWELAKNGAEVLLLEADELAAGASGGPGKRGVRANGRDLRELPLMKAAYEAWLSLHEEIDDDTGFERLGNLELIERPRELMAAPAVVWTQEEQGIPTTLLTGAEVRELEPDVSERVIAALHCPLDGVADQTATTLGVAAAAQALGAEIRTQTALTGVERTGERITAIITADEERITVGKALVLLTNTHVPHFLAEHFGITLPVWERLPQALLTEPVDPMPLSHLVGHAHRRLSMKPGPDHNVMISGGWMGKRNEYTGRAEIQPDQVTANLREAVAVYPSLAGITIQAGFVDRPESDAVDHIPIIDRVPEMENIFFATGWAGHGWAIAPAVSALLASWVLSGRRPPLLRPFAYERFFRSIE